MNWMNRFNNLWGGLRTMPAAAAMARNISTVYDDVGRVGSQLNSMTRSAIVATAVQLVSESVAGTALKVFYVGDRWLPLGDHPFVRVLELPNMLMSFFELMERTAQALELSGNAYWYYEPNEVGQIKEIWLLRSDRVAIIPDVREMVWGYLYDFNGTHVRIPAAQVTHFKRPHPLNDWFGLSALQAAWLEIASDRAMAEFAHGFFGRRVAKMDGILILPASLDDRRFDEARQEIVDSYGSTRATAVLRAGLADEAVDFKTTSISQRDMEYIEGRGFVRQVVLELLGIPTGMMSEASTEAHARVAERRFLDRIYKRHLRMAGKLDVDVMPLYGQNLRARFDDVRIADAEQLRARMQALKGVITQNEAREEVGLPPIEGGDVMENEPDRGGFAALRGLRSELGAFRRWARRGSGRRFEDFQFHCLGQEARRELRAAYESGNEAQIDRLVLELSGGNDERMVE